MVFFWFRTLQAPLNGKVSQKQFNGVILSIDIEESLLQIKFDERTVDYEFNDLDEIALAYATSIHKAQGSEYPVVVIPMSMQH